MANILNIDTSSSICSVALSIDGEIAMGLESSTKMDHSRSLAPFVEKCVSYLREKEMKLDAICVISGPGSYTGLRIGLSMAKGLCYGLNIPLITISALEVMAVRAIFSYPDFMGEEVIVPMMDARRMEVYTAAFNPSLERIIPETAMILDENSLSELINLNRKILLIGDGTEKFKPLYQADNVVWLGGGMPHAKYMTTLAEKYYREKKFSDVAYSTPEYLKDFQATKPKSPLFD